MYLKIFASRVIIKASRAKTNKLKKEIKCFLDDLIK